MYDFHMHTHHSFDAEGDMAGFARAAQKKGIGHICFTEHLELKYPCQSTPFDYTAYREEIEKLRSALPDIKIGMGVEAGLQTDNLEETAEAVAGKDYDFVIASQHLVNGRDPWYEEFHRYYGDVRKGQLAYLEEIYSCISAFDDFDVAGHIGYVDKYYERHSEWVVNPRPFEWEDFPEIIDEILRSIAGRGKGIEINTGFWQALGRPAPEAGIVKRFAELGGEIITIGSDAHRASEVGQCFRETRDFLQECGISYLCAFEQRTPQFYKI